VILFSSALSIMMSDRYGSEGSAELRAMAKKLRLDRTAVRSEGHPVDEHYIVPASKHPGMSDRAGVLVVSSGAIGALRVSKTSQVAARIAAPPPVSISSPPPPFKRSRGHRREREAA
jgi:hypothetical protein